MIVAPQPAVIIWPSDQPNRSQPAVPDWCPKRREAWSAFAVWTAQRPSGLARRRYRPRQVGRGVRVPALTMSVPPCSTRCGPSRRQFSLQRRCTKRSGRERTRQPTQVAHEQNCMIRFRHMRKKAKRRRRAHRKKPRLNDATLVLITKLLLILDGLLLIHVLLGPVRQ